MQSKCLSLSLWNIILIPQTHTEHSFGFLSKRNLQIMYSMLWNVVTLDEYDSNDNRIHDATYYIFSLVFCIKRNAITYTQIWHVILESKFYHISTNIGIELNSNSPLMPSLMVESPSWKGISPQSRKIWYAIKGIWTEYVTLTTQTICFIHITLSTFVWYYFY